MSRRPRLFVAGVPHHVIQRGNNKAPIFLSNKDYLLIARYPPLKCNTSFHIVRSW